MLVVVLLLVFFIAVLDADDAAVVYAVDAHCVVIGDVVRVNVVGCCSGVGVRCAVSQ